MNITAQSTLPKVRRQVSLSVRLGAAVAWMSVNPDSTELLGLATSVNSFVEEVDNRVVVELDRHCRAALTDEADVLHEQQIIGGRDTEAANFGVAETTSRDQGRERFASRVRPQFRRRHRQTQKPECQTQPQ